VTRVLNPGLPILPASSPYHAGNHKELPEATKQQQLIMKTEKKIISQL
jgi:hypothetical protein